LFILPVIIPLFPTNGALDFPRAWRELCSLYTNVSGCLLIKMSKFSTRGIFFYSGPRFWRWWLNLYEIWFKAHILCPIYTVSINSV
jgi:hypothetical protein